MQDRNPLLGLKAVGFAPISDAYTTDAQEKKISKAVAYLGKVDGYSVEVAFDWKTGWNIQPHFRIRAFYSSADSRNFDFQAQMQDVLARSDRFRWAQEDILLAFNYAETKVHLGKYHIPDTQTLLQAASHLTSEFKRLGLMPIEYGMAVGLIKQNQP